MAYGISLIAEGSSYGFWFKFLVGGTRDPRLETRNCAQCALLYAISQASYKP